MITRGSAILMETDFMASKKPKKKAKPKAAKPSPPSVPEYAIWTDKIEDSMSFIWSLGGRQPASPAKSMEDATKAAHKAIVESERVRLVGIYKLVATVRPDRTPIQTVVETR